MYFDISGHGKYKPPMLLYETSIILTPGHGKYKPPMLLYETSIILTPNGDNFLEIYYQPMLLMNIEALLSSFC